MKFNNISDCLDAIKDRMSELSEEEGITGSIDISASSNFNADEIAKFDSIFEEAESLSDTKDEITEFAYNRLLDLGYTDDQITQIFDYEGV